MSTQELPRGWPATGHNPIQKYHHESCPGICPSLPILSATGKKILITGGASGIGLAITKAFAAAGASRIAIVGRTQTSLDEIETALAESAPGAEVAIYAASLTDDAGIARIFDAERGVYGEFDIVVSNAAFFSGKTKALDIAEHYYKEAFDTNVHGNINAVSRYLKVLPTPESPKTIVDISTAVNHLPLPDMVLYKITKTAFTTYVTELGREYRDSGLRTFSLHPGSIYSNMPKKAGMLENGAIAWDHPNLPGHFVV